MVPGIQANVVKASSMVRFPLVYVRDVQERADPPSIVMNTVLVRRDVFAIVISLVGIVMINFPFSGIIC